VPYSQDGEIRSACRKLTAMPLLPSDEVKNAFHNLRASFDTRLKPELRQLRLCFDSHWMTDVPLATWNLYGYEPKTNNVCESMSIYLSSAKSFDLWLWDFTTD
jgi:hypothetical protein